MHFRHPVAWALACGSLLGAGLSAHAQPSPLSPPPPSTPTSPASPPSSASPAAGGEVPTFRACGGQVTRAEQDAAKGLFAAGRQAYEEGEYRRAIRYWRDSFDLDCNAVLILRNLANAYERARNLRGAIASLEAYLARKPDADDAPGVRRRVEALRRELETAPPPPPEPSAPPAASVTAAPSASAPIGAAIVDSDRGPGPWPWVLTGAGGVALAAGLYFFLDGSARVSDVRDACGGTNCEASSDPDARAEAERLIDRGNGGRTRQGIGWGLMGGGAAMIAGGLTWYFVSAPKHSSTDTGLWLTPAFGPGYGGIGASGRF
ncbi:MAG TPA: tetratricopeptide repeat protein [Polyangiaceae bacterium]|nr:tetratricopeptide repeat protein [Polyangiaceae bacterium]